MRVLLLFSLILTLAACSDDSSSNPSKPDAPSGQDEKKQEESIEVTGSILEKPTVSTITIKQEEVQETQVDTIQTPQMSSNNNRSLPADPTRVSSGQGAKVDMLDRSITLESVRGNIKNVRDNLDRLQQATDNEPLDTYIQRVRQILASNMLPLDRAGLGYCIDKYSDVAPKNTSICYYKFGMGTDVEKEEFLKLSKLYRQEMFTSGDIKMIAQEEDYCDGKYKTIMPKVQTKCYFIMGYGTPEEYEKFIDTSIKLEAEKVADAQRRLDELASQYRESKK